MDNSKYMIGITRAGTFASACRAGLILSDIDEYGECQWLGSRDQFQEWLNLEMGDSLSQELYGY